MLELSCFKSKYSEAKNLDSCFRVASLGKLGAMLGKLPSLETRNRVIWEIFICTVLSMIITLSTHDGWSKEPTGDQEGGLDRWNMCSSQAPEHHNRQ